MASIPLVRQTPSARGLGADFSDRLAAAAALAAAAPVLFLSAAALAALSGRSPLIAHRRVGWRGSTLWMLKLRTMWDESSPGPWRWVEYIDDETGPLQKSEHDSRVPSRFAQFCRRHSIDELPQLLHVICGEMAWVGPRPLTAGELRRYYGGDEAEVLDAKPGMVGLWQVSGRNRLTYAERRQLDLKLVRERSPWLCLRILIRSVGAVLSGVNCW